MKSQNNKRVIRVPKIITQQRDFAEIDKFIRSIARDAVFEIRDGDKWLIVQTTTEKENYCVLTALDGWCDCFAQIAAKIQFDYNDKPLRALISKLRLDQAINADLFNQAKNVVDTQRKIYMLAPHKIINQVASGLLSKAAQ
jgi:hypothetical protein